MAIATHNKSNAHYDPRTKSQRKIPSTKGQTDAKVAAVRAKRGQKAESAVKGTPKPAKKPHLKGPQTTSKPRLKGPKTTSSAVKSKPRLTGPKTTSNPVNSASKPAGVASKTSPRSWSAANAANKASKLNKSTGGAVSKAGAAVKVGGAVLAPLAAYGEIKRTIDQKNDPARPTAQEHGAKAKARRAKLKQHDFNPEKTAASRKWVSEFGAKVAKKKAQTAASKKWVSEFASKRAPTSAAKGGDPVSKPAAKTASGTKKRGYSYTGPKVGSDEYKAMRKKKYEKRKATAFAKTQTGRARIAAKSRTSAKQQGTTTANYQQPVMSRRNGNEHRQNTYTGDSATTSANLAKSTETPTSGGGEEKNFWGKHGPRLAKTWNELTR